MKTRSSFLVKGLIVVLALSLSACAAVRAQRQAEQAKKQAFVHRVDMAHIYVTPDNAPPGKPYQVLGNITYTVPFTPEAIDAQHIKQKLKKIAYKKWPDDIDAVIKEKSAVSTDGTSVTVSGQAIQFNSTVDRTALHEMNEGIVASPSGD